MKKIIIFILILCCMPITILFGGASKLKNPAQPQLNPVQINFVSEQVGPAEAENTKLTHPMLKYRGTILLNSPHPAFGGFSDLLVSSDRSTILAVSDMGFWLKGRLTYSPSGFLKGVERKAEMGQLLDSKGKIFAVKYDADAEALCRAPNSGYLVAFERVHRINRYDSGKLFNLSGTATDIPLPIPIKKAPFNAGIESMLLLPDQSLFVLSEGDDSAGSISPAALLADGKWINFGYQRNSSYHPTSAGNFPDRKILVLERKYNGPGTMGIRLSTIDMDNICEGATLYPKLFTEISSPIPRDNYEGMDTITGSDGKVWIYIISDNNFSPLQHTLLTLFELDITE